MSVQHGHYTALIHVGTAWALHCIKALLTFLDMMNGAVKIDSEFGFFFFNFFAYPQSASSIRRQEFFWKIRTVRTNPQVRQLWNTEQLSPYHYFLCGVLLSLFWLLWNKVRSFQNHIIASFGQIKLRIIHFFIRTDISMATDIQSPWNTGSIHPSTHT